MSDIFHEANMWRTLEKYVPAGETLLAGVHGVSHKTNIRGIFGKCVRTGVKLIPDERGGVLSLNKKKYLTYDIFMGITQHSLIIIECEHTDYIYQFDDMPDTVEANVQELPSAIHLADIGTCFPLSELQSCKIKRGWAGSVKCFLAMKNGSSFKLMLPKEGGPDEEMPHHGEYRMAIISRLKNRV